MVLKKLFERKQPKAEASEEFLDLADAAINEDNKIGIRIESLKDFIDTERIQQFVREGNVIFLRIKELRNRDATELKRSVEKLKKTCVAMNGDIAGIDEDFLVLTPKFARVYRG